MTGNQIAGTQDRYRAATGNVVEQLESIAATNGWLDRPAYFADAETYRYRDVFDGAGRAAAVFASRGLGVGDRVLLALPDSIDLVCALLGALRAGIVATPVNADLHPSELGRGRDRRATRGGV